MVGILEHKNLWVAWIIQAYNFNQFNSNNNISNEALATTATINKIEEHSRYPLVTTAYLNSRVAINGLVGDISFNGLSWDMVRWSVSLQIAPCLSSYY